MLMCFMVWCNKVLIVFSIVLDLDFQVFTLPVLP